jgi:hypothetical protein
MPSVFPFVDLRYFQTRVLMPASLARSRVDGRVHLSDGTSLRFL